MRLAAHVPVEAWGRMAEGSLGSRPAAVTGGWRREYREAGALRYTDRGVLVPCGTTTYFFPQTMAEGAGDGLALSPISCWGLAVSGR
jgi:hypothetical protein